MGESHDELRPLQRHWVLAIPGNHNIMSKHHSSTTSEYYSQAGPVMPVD